MFSNLYYSFIEILFPTKCIGCKKTGIYLCDSCVSSIPSPQHDNLENIDACFDYQHPLIKKSIWDLKYYNKKHISDVLGKHLSIHASEQVSELRQIYSGQPFIVIPIPLSKQRKHERGYNQAEHIARAFIKHTGSGIFELHTDIIYKIKDTGHQARIHNKKIRLKNMIGAFSINKKTNLKNRIVFVIDDVTTTGATLHEVMKLVKKAGAREVHGLAVAH